MKRTGVIVLLSVICLILQTGCGAEEAVSSATSTEAVVDTTEVIELAEETEELESTETVESVASEETEVMEVVETTETTEELEFAIAALDKTMYATKNVNLRQGPSTDYEKVGSLKTNDAVHVIGQADTGWYQIEYNGQSAYVADSFLSDTKVEVQTNATSNTASSNSTASTSASNTGVPVEDYGDEDGAPVAMTEEEMAAADAAFEAEQAASMAAADAAVPWSIRFIAENGLVPGNTYTCYERNMHGGYGKVVYYVVSEAELSIVSEETLTEEEYYAAMGY